MRVKRADTRRIDEMRVEIGVMQSVKDKLVGSTWASHVAKKVNAQKFEGKTGRRRPKMRCGIVTQKEWEKNGEKEQQVEEIRDC